MKRVEVNCATGETTVKELTQTEEDTIQEKRSKYVQEMQEKVKATQDAAQKRANSIDTIVNSPELASNKELKEALVHLLGL